MHGVACHTSPQTQLCVSCFWAHGHGLSGLCHAMPYLDYFWLFAEACVAERPSHALLILGKLSGLRLPCMLAPWSRDSGLWSRSCVVDWSMMDNNLCCYAACHCKLPLPICTMECINGAGTTGNASRCHWSLCLTCAFDSLAHTEAVLHIASTVLTCVLI